MTLKARSYRVSDETANRLKNTAQKTGRPIQRVMAAAIAYFDPVHNEEHLDYLLNFEKQTSTVELANDIQNMPAEERDKLLKMLQNSK